VKSPFSRRRRRSKGRAAKPKAVEPEVVDWPEEGTGRPSMMAVIRGDAAAGAGFGVGVFEDLHAMFSGGKKIQLEQQEAEKMRRQDDHQQAGSGRPDLESGVIRIQRPERED
jgi:hypothetical protein